MRREVFARVGQPASARALAYAGSLAIVLLFGCATVAPAPDRPPEVRVQTVTLTVPVPVPCFTEADRPAMPKPTPVDVETATTLQLVAAEAADAIAWQIFAEKVDALFKACTTTGVNIP